MNLDKHLNIHEYRNYSRKETFMLFWIQLFIILIIIFAILEEAIYFFVNRSVFGRSDLEKKYREWLKKFISKIRMINRSTPK